MFQHKINVLSPKKYRNILSHWLSYHNLLIRCHSRSHSTQSDATFPRYPDYARFEKKWYRFWEDKKLFKPSATVDAKETFSMILPPPNITGNLHLGHALTVAVQDAIFRHQKMSGKNCLWIPGYDHAGIATQLILNKMLAKQRDPDTNKEISGEDFEKFANQWKHDRISDIRNQLKSIGASLDFSKEFFTLSPEISRAVKEAFIRLHEDGIIFRKNGIVNWSFHLQSTLSDIEIKWLHLNKATSITVPGYEIPVQFGTLHSFAYKLVDDPGREVIVSTTRIETMVGDTAIAVNPSDARYSDLVGKACVHPLTGQHIPIIADKLIEKDFGTGAMKVTPAHSAIDYTLAQAHKLKITPIFDDRGFINCEELLSDYSSINGVRRFDAKQRVVDILDSLGLYRGVEDHKTTVPVCARSGDVIESKLLPQWFVNHKLLVNDVRDALSSGEINVSPEGQKAAWLKWLNDQDWCISRQISWGHQVPAYQVYIDGQIKDTWVAATDDGDAIKKASKQFSVEPSRLSVVQDKDVLDTWFSSALLPFTAIGWPNGADEIEFKKFYPLSLMETGFDILGFWVSRMAILSKRLTGQFGFKNVLLHGMVCDAFGKKMTKSLGNVIDPVDVISGASIQDLLDKSNSYFESGILTKEQLEKAQVGQRKLFPGGIPECGADALRLSLFKNNPRSQIIKLSVKNISHNRHFTNKMWQTFRFFTMYLDKLPADHQWVSELNDLTQMKEQLTDDDLWILTRLVDFIELCNVSMENYDFNLIYNGIQDFFYMLQDHVDLHTSADTIHH
ncbi:Valine--tRNA ligase [Halotydeus destructor]|nr:Valine--tRNA ligase [Halotydeus destructor]